MFPPINNKKKIISVLHLFRSGNKVAFLDFETFTVKMLMYNQHEMIRIRMLHYFLVTNQVCDIGHVRMFLIHLKHAVLD